MELRTYLFLKEISICEFARKLKMSRQHLSGIVNYRIIPGKFLAEKIERETEGHVKWEDLKEPPK